ncbi:MAG TPA: molecular chaperone TorD family protein [Nitrososphaerales archaeon]|jgi:DMSO reductase family type II enzyme chaperone|nr:molecular chaperone TorD family protein [Nitrososphaerales archaeon]|tara:strand:+ start:1188 stop:1901 length:714 start_codon:yes stop_codon:yes gene_type:complete
MTTSDVKELLARSVIYRLLSLGFLYPTKDLVDTLRDEAHKADKEFNVYGQWATRLTKVFEECVDSKSISGLESDYSRLFEASVQTPCPPYESSYGSVNTFGMTRQLADVAGFYRAFGLKLSSTKKEMPDHISAEMEFMHILTLKEAHATMEGWTDKISVTRDAQKKFLLDHLGRWASAICMSMQKSADAEFYRELAKITNSHIKNEVNLLNIKPKKVRKSVEEENPVEDVGCPEETD